MTASPAASLKPGTSARDPLLDNAKYLAILLVVCAHLIENLRDVKGAHALYFFVYLFHMPLFIVISGYLSRNFTFSAGKARKLISGLAVPYVIFETLYSMPRFLLYGKLEISLLDPYYLTWFLMSLFLWRLSTPVWQQLRWPLVVAVGLSLLSGTSALPDELSMNRTLGLLPFYVLGLMLKPEHFDILRQRWARIAGAAVLVVGLAVAFAVHMKVPTEWIRWRHANSAIGVDDLTGSLTRLALLATGALLVAAFIAITPRRRVWFTGLGAATMYAYLLHGFVVKVLERFYNRLDTPLGVTLVIVFGVVLATVLCTWPVRFLTKWAVEPNMSWAFTKLRRPESQVKDGSPAPAVPSGSESEQSREPAVHG
ncbi:acyltransferase family protein [Planotetraspora phitsanulokensis]|uniref:Membrane protein n=1 Tax=Planotetraspora phitsanulokensis TaxID=575192 RepID=A0A8J3XIK7_9ACTN|nr:acyltransferase family protein [Planotetraspora phitsanulokensis]GII41031.1 membrane protein [Planotetraspora phitsanulokensis]